MKFTLKEVWKSCIILVLWSPMVWYISGTWKGMVILCFGYIAVPFMLTVYGWLGLSDEIEGLAKKGKVNE